MSYEILQKREVPDSEINITVSGEIVTHNNVHGGDKAVCVRIACGMMAWGFGPCWESAEQNAVREALAIA